MIRRATKTKARLLSMKRLNWIAALASAVLWLAARPAEVVAQVSPASEVSPALENDQIEILYSEPNASYFKPIYERYKSRHLLEQAEGWL